MSQEHISTSAPIHGSMYVDGKPGTVCAPGSGWNPRVTTVSAHITCSACLRKMEGGGGPDLSAAPPVPQIGTIDPHAKQIFAGLFYEDGAGDGELTESWVPCEGQEVSREEFSSLFEILGTKYGPGDGEITFNLPDLRTHPTPWPGEIDTSGLVEVVADDRIKALKAASDVLATKGSAGAFATPSRQPANLHDLLTVAEYINNGPSAACAFSNLWIRDAGDE